MVGGRAIPPDEESSIIMHILPKEMKEKVIYDHIDTFANDPEKLKVWVRETVKKYQLWKLGHGQTHHLGNGDDEDREEDEGMTQEIMSI